MTASIMRPVITPSDQQQHQQERPPNPTSKVNNSSPASSPSPEPSKASDPHHEEHQYLSLLRSILSTGEHRPDRTGTGTLAIPFPPQLKFTLSRPSSTESDSNDYDLILPLLTTKRVYIRAVLHELLWFISGATHAGPLSAAGVKIWDGNGSRSYLDSVGLSHYAEGELGPVYGFQWRHFGAEYKPGVYGGKGVYKHVDTVEGQKEGDKEASEEHAEDAYEGQGVDQLAEVMRKLRTTPYDRRIILSAWNAADLTKMALPPCHMFAQFYVEFPDAPRGVDALESLKKEQSEGISPEQKPKAKGVLHTLLYQRSCDMGLGVPFNIASYALLTHILAHVCDLRPGTLTHTMGDAHIYLDHVDALKTQIERTPRDFPLLRIHNREKGGSVDGWQVEDFEVVGYDPHKGIAMKMSV